MEPAFVGKGIIV